MAIDALRFTLDDFAFPSALVDGGGEGQDLERYFVEDDFTFLTGIAPPVPPVPIIGGVVYDGGRDHSRFDRLQEQEKEKRLRYRKKLKRQKELDIILALEYMRMENEA